MERRHGDGRPRHAGAGGGDGARHGAGSAAPGGARKDDLLLGPEEARLMHRLRRILSALDNQAAIDLLIKQLRKH
ncbi:hypothetical protein CXF43_10360, partial [Corynebacterium bovis]|uniref:hypothetical protein n=1 Tax=Corynebacterium bovis TaxID=36808 RepID=UPI000F9F5CF1